MKINYDNMCCTFTIWENTCTKDSSSGNLCTHSIPALQPVFDSVHFGAQSSGMTEVPPEAVEFARMLVRAFYPAEAVVALDGVLRANNYCAHNDLAHRLKMPPKELRSVLVKMMHSRLMKSEKRQQRRININDDRRATRTVSTEFWYVPLREVVDAFVYRMHKITSELEAAMVAHGATRTYRCTRCRAPYAEVDLVSRVGDNGFICDRFGVGTGRRPGLCGGLIEEEDNTVAKKETEALKRRMEVQLKPLRERAEKCMRLTIPAHPLDGADEETWGALVPETIGVHGEKVDEDGFTPEMVAQLNAASGKVPVQDNSQLTPLVPLVPADDEPVIEKPSWFKDNTAADEDNDDDWDEEGAQQNMLKTANGTAASFGGAEDSKSYYEQFLRAAGGMEEEKSVAKKEPAASKVAATNAEKSTTSGSQAKSGDVVTADDRGAAGHQGETEAKAATEEVCVTVAGRKVKLSEVTEDMYEEMTAEEYQAYFALAKIGGDDEDEDY